MKSFWIIPFLIISISATANGSTTKPVSNKKDHKLIFNVLPLNSPVKGESAKFRLEAPSSFEVDKIKVKVVNAKDVSKRIIHYKVVNLSNETFSINVSSLPPGYYKLFVMIIDKNNKKEYAYERALRDHTPFIIDESLEVPIPNSKKNNATVEGVDIDRDGIRDDIQRYINETYSEQPKVKMAAKQLARSTQVDLLSVDNKEESILAGRNLLDSVDCLHTIVGLSKEAAIRKDIKSRILNTKARLEANIKANANFNGQTYHLPDGVDAGKATCHFDPDSI